MKLADINPHIRFAEEITYSSKNRNVYAKDCRLFYIISGNGKISIKNTDVLLRKNTLFYCCGGIDYTIDTEEHLHLFSLNFDLSQTHRRLIAPIIPQNLNEIKNPSPIDFCNINDSSFLNSYFVILPSLSISIIFKVGNLIPQQLTNVSPIKWIMFPQTGQT